MEKYKRLTEKRETPLALSQWGGTSQELKIYNRLAELEDKIENGTLIELPCKVGDKFYEIDSHCCEYREHEVSGFTFENNDTILFDWYFCVYKASEVCFSKAEAEKKLKELRNEK